MWTDIGIHAALMAATTCYAVILSRHAEWSLDHTVWEVIVGVVLVILAVAVQVEIWPDMSAHETLVRMVSAFIIGGLPIIIWQVAEMIRRRDQTIDYDVKRARKRRR
jgi:protein-S-isoprenylcysteine O-methyltransferase Ste14